MLDEHLAQLEEDRRQLDNDRGDFDERARNEAEALTEARRRSEQHNADKRRQLDLRAKKLKEQETVARQIQDDVTCTHREAMEARFVVEQLWAQLSAQVRPAELAESMSHIRGQLAEHYRYESESIAQQKMEVLPLLEKLSQKQEDVCRQRAELQDWVARRHEEIEEQAARLVAREQELDRQEQLHKKRQHDWAHERRSFQQQIRQFTKAPQRVPA